MALMRKTFFLGVAVLFICCGSPKRSAQVFNPASASKTVDVVFCLDLSGSTNQLVNALKMQIWDILSSFENYENRPVFRFAVIGAGRVNFHKEADYVKILCPFTDNIDEFTSSIYRIEPFIREGRANNVNTVISQALKSLNWDKDPSSAHLVYVIGNGRIAEGETSALPNAALAADKGITVNAIFCENTKNKSEFMQWQLLAKAGGGHFYIFNPLANPTVYRPFHKYQQLLKLNDSLNATYRVISKVYIRKKKILTDIDSMAGQFPGSTLQNRILLKASSLYQNNNYEWDIVDAQKKAPGVPAFLRSSDPLLDAETQKAMMARINRIAEERDAIVQKINALRPEVSNDLIQQSKAQPENYSLKEILISSLHKHLQSESFVK